MKTLEVRFFLGDIFITSFGWGEAFKGALPGVGDFIYFMISSRKKRFRVVRLDWDIKEESVNIICRKPRWWE